MSDQYVILGDTLRDEQRRTPRRYRGRFRSVVLARGLLGAGQHRVGECAAQAHRREWQQPVVAATPVQGRAVRAPVDRMLWWEPNTCKQQVSSL